MFGSGPSTSTPAIQLAEVPNEVWVLISVATHHPDLDFVAIYRGYADGWSTDEIHALGESLVPHAQMVAEQVTAQWVMEAHRSSIAKDMR